MPCSKAPSCTRRWRGHEITFKYLTVALNVLGGPGFKYVREWRGDSGAVLEFENEIEGVRINGVDIITFSGDGKLITHFKVMIRPVKAINLAHRLMGEQLAAFRSEPTVNRKSK
jgi:hypothetical protein